MLVQPSALKIVLRPAPVSYTHLDVYKRQISRFPEDIREMLARQGIQSMLQCAIKDNGEFKGWVGFDDCTSKCMWTISQIEILSFISELLSLFLLKRRAQDNAMELAEDQIGRAHV